MKPQRGHAIRSRCSVGGTPGTSRSPQFEQYVRTRWTQRGGPSPDGRSVERPSGPRPRAAARRRSSSPSSRSVTSRAQHEPDRAEAQRHEHERGDQPGEPEQRAAAIDGHPGPSRAPDPECGVRGGDQEQRRREEDAGPDQEAVKPGAELGRGDRDRAQDEGRGRQQDEVLLERRRLRFRDAPGREAAQARGQVRVGAVRARDRHRLAVQHGHPLLPALVVHDAESIGARVRRALAGGYARRVNPYLTLRRASHASSVAIAVLIAANVVPLVGVVLLGWDLATLVAVYWAENGVVGLYAVGRVLTAGRV